MVKNKKFICRFKLPDGKYTMLSVSGENLDEKKAEIKAVDYMEANGRIAEFIIAYEDNS